MLKKERKRRMKQHNLTKPHDLHKILDYLDSGDNGQQASQEPGTGFSLLYSTLGYMHHQRSSQNMTNDSNSGSGFQGGAGAIPSSVMHAATVSVVANNNNNNNNNNGGHGHGHGHPVRRCIQSENITTGAFSRSQAVPTHVAMCKSAMKKILKRHKAIQERMAKSIDNCDKGLLLDVTQTKVDTKDDINENDNDDNNNEDDDDADNEEEEGEEVPVNSSSNEDDNREGSLDDKTKSTLRKVRRICGCGCRDLVELVLHNLGGAAFSSTISRVLLDLPVVQVYNSYSRDSLAQDELEHAVDFVLDKNRDTFVQYVLGPGLCFWVLGRYLLGFATAAELTEIREYEIPDLKDSKMLDYDDVSYYLCSGVANSAKYDTLHGAVLRFLENELLYAAQDRAGRGPGFSHTEDIVDFVLCNWCRPHSDITDDILRQEVVTTLQTSPLFSQSRSNTEFWRPSPLAERVLPKEWRFSPDVLAGKRPVRSSREGTTVAAASLLLATEMEKEAARQNKAAAVQTGSKKHKSFADGDSGGGFASTGGGSGGGNGSGGNGGDRDADQGAGAKIRAGPKFLSCSRCGADIPGRGPNAGWKIGQNRDDVLCLDCCVVVDVTVSCVICGKQYSRGDDNSDDEVDEGDENEWICCDGCHRWAMVSCDPTISDIKEYDESLDNPKKYFCPYCVHHKRQMQYFRFLAESTVRSNQSAQKTAVEPQEPSQKKAKLQLLPDEEGCETDEYVESAVKQFTDEIYPALIAENARSLTLEQKEEVAAFKDGLAKKIRYVLRGNVRSHNELIRKLNTDLEKHISWMTSEIPVMFRENLEKNIFSKQKH